MAGIFLLACVAVGIFVLSRSSDTAPVRYRSVVTVRIAPKPKKKAEKSKAGKQTSTTTVASVALSGQQIFALKPPIRAAALTCAGLPTNSPQIAFAAAVSSEGDVLLLSVTAPGPQQATKVAKCWSDAYVKARRDAAKQTVAREKITLNNRRNALDAQLKDVNRILQKLMPIVYRDILRNSAPFGRGPDGRFGGEILPEPAVPSNGQTSVLNLAYQRAALLTAIDEISKKVAVLNIANATPEVFAEPEAQTPAIRVTEAPSTAIPAGLGLLAGLLLALAAAVALDRLDGRIRTPEQAAEAFRAPVLSVIPADDWDFPVLDDPLSIVAQAYRGLAATSIATDHLPKAIMVSTPYGDAHEEVAANFAAALSRLGLRVALMATDADQSWFSGAFADPTAGALTLPELLARAHDGTLNGELRDRLPTTDRAPNLVLLPPAEEEMLELPLDGLPPLLEALSNAGIDVAVVAGPALLEHPDATIVAWATRSVLWALFSGEVTQDEARAGAARLQLAGVTPFGVVMVGARRTTSV